MAWRATCRTQVARRLPAQKRASVVTCAKASSSGKLGYRWDPANLRWRRNEKYAEGNQITGGTMKPLSGGEYTVWPVVWEELNEKKVKTVTPEEASVMVTKGWTLVDVRLKEQFDAQHVAGSVSLPLFRYVEGDSKWDKLKRLAMASFAMAATERNVNFKQDALKVLKKNQKVIVLCDLGGTLNTKITSGLKSAKDPERVFGRESRSLKAAYELLQLGWSGGNVAHLDGGLPKWRYQGYPVE